MLSFLLILISFPAAARVEDFLNLLSGKVEGPQALAACLEFQGDEWSRDADSHPPEKLPCPTDWYAKDFHYDLDYYHCRARFGKTALTCVETDVAKVKERVANDELMAKMKTFTEYKFESYKNNLASDCCGGRQKCLTRFGQTRLEITPDEKSEASYLSNSSPSTPGVIQVSAGKLASAMNQENVERVLLVELAHACQFALISESDADYKTFTTDRCSIESGKLMFREGLGPKMSSCLDQELQSQINAIPVDQRGKYCFGKWYREAFSDMKFRSQFTSIYHWSYDFMRRSQATNYGSVYKYVNCGITPALKDQVCK